MAAVPKVIKNFNLLVDGNVFAGLVQEVKLPDLKIKKELQRAGGMDAPRPIDLGMEEMELGFTMDEHSPLVFRQFGLISQNAVALTFKAAQVDDTSVTPYWIDVRGMYVEQRLGTVKNGDIAKLEATLSLRYYKLQINGTVIHEVDVDNMVRTINGVDQMLQIRNAIGL